MCWIYFVYLCFFQYFSFFFFFIGMINLIMRFIIAQCKKSFLKKLKGDLVTCEKTLNKQENFKKIYFHYLFLISNSSFSLNWLVIIYKCFLHISLWFLFFGILFLFHLYYVHVVLFNIASYYLCFEDYCWTFVCKGKHCPWPFKCSVSCCEKKLDSYFDTKCWNSKLYDFFFVGWSQHHFLELFKRVKCVVGNDML